MAVNPMGFQSPFDFGVPQFITVQVGTVAAAISGGQIAYLTSGTANVVTSGLTSYISSDLQANVPASGINFPLGVVVQNAVSGTYVAVMVRGVAILPASTDILPGDPVSCINGAHAVDVITSGAAAAQMDIKQRLGRALTGAASGTTNFVLVHVGGL